MGVENESVVGLPGLLGIFRKSPKSSYKHGKIHGNKKLGLSLISKFCFSDYLSRFSLISSFTLELYICRTKKLPFLPVNEEPTAVYQAVQCATITF